MLQRPLLAGEEAESGLGELALTWVEHDLAARLIVDEQLAILWGNTAARSYLARRREIENRGGVLVTVDRAKQCEFERFIWDAGASAGSWCLARANGDGHLIFRAQRLSWSHRGVFGLMLSIAGTDHRAQYADLGACFNLTKSENKILLELLGGRETDDIARLLSISIETVRSHIRNIYNKLAVSSREALFHKVRPYCL